MKVSIERLEGERDAIRYGRIRFAGERVMTFSYDRLSGRVALAHHDNNVAHTSAPTAAELSAATRALHAALPPLTEEIAA